MRQDDVPDETCVPQDVGPRLGRAQRSAAPRVEADIEAIRELNLRVQELWATLAAPSRTYLRVRLELLRAAADRRDTDTRAVRETLQQLLIHIGTGALAPLSRASRRRLTALTGITLPGGSPGAYSRVVRTATSKHDRERSGNRIQESSMGLGDILNTAAVVLRNVNDAAIINNWLQMTDQGAYEAIAAQVANSPTEAVDRLDGALLGAAANTIDRAARLRLIKFYAMFKVVEVVRYEEFRGFPA